MFFGFRVSTQSIISNLKNEKSQFSSNLLNINLSTLENIKNIEPHKAFSCFCVFNF